MILLSGHFALYLVDEEEKPDTDVLRNDLDGHSMHSDSSCHDPYHDGHSFSSEHEVVRAFAHYQAQPGEGEMVAS